MAESPDMDLPEAGDEELDALFESARRSWEEGVHTESEVLAELKEEAQEDEPAPPGRKVSPPELPHPDAPPARFECPHCGATISDGAKFCGHCGQPVQPGTAIEIHHCPYCGAKIGLHAHFCGRCGRSLTT